jgi:hypothetical protein
MPADLVPDCKPARGTDTGTSTNYLLINTVSAPGFADLGAGTGTDKNYLTICTVSALSPATPADLVPDRIPARVTDTGTGTNYLSIYTVSAPGPADLDPGRRPAHSTSTGTVSAVPVRMTSLGAGNGKNYLLICTVCALSPAAPADLALDRIPASGTDIGINHPPINTVSATGPADLGAGTGSSTGENYLLICTVSALSPAMPAVQVPDRIPARGTDTGTSTNYLPIYTVSAPGTVIPDPAAHVPEVNCTPLSVVMATGRP